MRHHTRARTFGYLMGPGDPSTAVTEPMLPPSDALAPVPYKQPMSTGAKVLIGLGVLGAVGLFWWQRRKIKGAVSQAASSAGRAIKVGFSNVLSAVEKQVLSVLTPAGREGYVNGAFEVGKELGVDPWLLVGILKVEGDFGDALTESIPGAFFGRTVDTGDFIPRPATPALDAWMAKYPLPGAKRVYWENKLRGKGTMWVPAHDERVAAAGGVRQAYAKNPLKVPGGIGWGFTPWQLDWGTWAEQLKAGAAWDERAATRAAITYIKSLINTGKKQGYSGDNLIKGVIAGYNAGPSVFERARREGKGFESYTVLPKYVPMIFEAATKTGHKIVV